MSARILIVMAAPDWEQAEAALQEAHRQAAEAQRLSVGLCIAEEPDEKQEREMLKLPAVRYLAPGWDAWRDAGALWRGEEYVLIVPPEAKFGSKWDQRLCQALRDCDSPACALTGWLPSPTDAIDAVRPVAAKGFDDKGRLLFTAGTPLRYAKRSERAAFLHPEFCFAPAAFFRAVAEEGPPYFLAAFRRRWRLFTLREPILRVTETLTVSPCAVPAQAEGLDRFERFFEISFAQRQLSPRARVGIWTPDLTVPTAVPLRVRVQERLRSLDNAVSRLDPLCVTACFAMPGAGDTDERLARFRYLSAIERMQLVCYADRQAGIRLKTIHPYIAEFRPGIGLKSPVPVTRENMGRWARLSKPFLLTHARDHDLSRTHFIWIDFDCLGYPVYRKAALDWQTVCGERIVLALVDGQPDLSMFSVPQALVPLLCREISGRCGVMDALPGERALWQGIMRDFPDWFAPVELPGRRELLSLTMLSRGEEWGRRE